MSLPDATRLYAEFRPGAYERVFETDAVDDMPVAGTRDGSALPETLGAGGEFPSDDRFRRTGGWTWDTARVTATATAEFLGSGN